MDLIRTFEIAITLFFQGLGDWLALPMKSITFLGQEDFYMLILPVLYWCLNPALGIRVGAILTLSGSINCYFKEALHGPRPYWFDSRVTAWISESSFGIPSGHAMNAMTVWGVIGNFFRSWGGKVLVGLIIFLIGLSRIYLGAHFTSDVLTGWLLGALLLWAFLRWEKPVMEWAKRLSLRQQVLVSFITSLLLVAINAIVLALFAGWQIPEAWIQTASITDPEGVIAPYSVTGMLTNAGIWFGLFAGLAWLHTKGTYTAAGSFEKRALRYIVGVIGVAIFWYGLGQIFPRGEDLISYVLRYLRYSLVGLWVSALAPMLFIRLGLAEKLRPHTEAERTEHTKPVPAQTA